MRMRSKARKEKLPVPPNNRLRELRKRAGLTQVGLAGLLGLRHPTISRWETGTAPISVRYLMKLSEVLHCHPGAILCPLPAEPAMHIGDASFFEMGRMLTPKKRVPSWRIPSAVSQLLAQKIRSN